MEQPILLLPRMAFLSLWKDPGGIPPRRIAWFLLPRHYWLGKMQPVKAWTHPDQLRSRSSPPLFSRQQGKGPTSSAAQPHTVPTSPNPSRAGTGRGAGTKHHLPAELLGAGAEAHREDLMEREDNGALPSPLHSPAAVLQTHVLSMRPRCLFSSPKGKWRELEGDRGTESSWGAHIHHHSCSHKPQVHHPLGITGTGSKNSVPIHCGFGVGMPISQDSSPGPNTALPSSCFPWLQAEAGGAHPLQTEGSPVGFCGAFDCCWFGSDLVCVIRLQKDLPRRSLTPLTAAPSKGPPHPSETRSAQPGCTWGWPGRRRFLKAANSTAGSSGTGGELWQATSTVPAGSAGASTGSFSSVSDALSVLWEERFAQSTKELWG